LRSLTDAELLCQFRAAHTNEAFAEIVARHGSSVLRTCVRLLKNVQEAEDAAQATFLVLVQQADRVNRPLGVWLHEVAWHTAYNLVRARIRRYRREQQVAQVPVSIPMAEATHDLRDELDAALRRLPGALREAVILRYLEGRGQEEAARLAGCPQGTLARRSMEGLNRLREVLVHRGAALSVGAITAFMAQEAAVAAPAKTLTALGMLSGAANVPTAVALLAHGATKALFWAKVKAYALIASLVTVTAVAPVVVMQVRKPSVQYQQQATLTGPVRPVKSWWVAAFSPNGKTLAVAFWDKTIKVWDVASRQELHTITSDDHAFICAAFSPDGQTLATGYMIAGGKPFVGVRLWDLATGQVRRDLRGHTENVYAVAFHPDGKTLLSSSRDGIRFWDVETGLQRRSFPKEGIYFNSASYSPDGKIIALAGGSQSEGYELPGTVRLLDGASGATLGELTGHTSYAYVVAFSPDGKTLATSDYRGMVRLWDVESRRKKAELKHNWPVVSLAFSRDGRVLAAAGGKHDQASLNWIVQAPGEVKFWDVRSAKELATMQSDPAPALPVAFSPDGKTLVTGAADGTVKLWDVTWK
jgi:RNA polymerase sigma factor (sigma-70 family)